MSRHDGDDAAATKGITRVAAGPGQSSLSSALFGRSSAPMDGDGVDAEDLDVVTVQGNLESTVKTPDAKKGSKRKLLPSGKQATSKVHRPCGRTPQSPRSLLQPWAASSTSLRSVEKVAL